MISIRKPTAEVIGRLSADQAGRDFTYAGVSGTATEPPAGYVVDRTRALLGTGEAVFEAAKGALRRWEQFRFDWLEMATPETPIRTGEIATVLAHLGGLWSLNFCRIVYVVDETEPVCRFGFAYGTLPDHMESGEERFLVEWNRETGEVFYDILAFSKPQHLLARLGYPVVRRLQKKFARDSVAAMRRAVGAP